MKGCKYVNEIIPYTTETDLEDILKLLDIDVRILGDEYQDKNFTGRDYCEASGIRLLYNKRNHRFSSSGLRLQVYENERLKKA